MSKGLFSTVCPVIRGAPSKARKRRTFCIHLVLLLVVAALAGWAIVNAGGLP